jgi:hypothetical protein
VGGRFRGSLPKCKAHKEAGTNQSFEHYDSALPLGSTTIGAGFIDVGADGRC